MSRGRGLEGLMEAAAKQNEMFNGETKEKGKTLNSLFAGNPSASDEEGLNNESHNNKEETASLGEVKTVSDAADTPIMNPPVVSVEAEDEVEIKEKTKTETRSAEKKTKNPSKKKVSGKERTLSEYGNVIGRPRYEDKGLEKKKQYSISLSQSTYEEINKIAIEEDRPFSKIVEYALLDYLKKR